MSRSDYLEAISFNEYLGMGFEMRRFLGRDAIVKYGTSFTRYWEEISPNLQIEFEGATWIGGDGKLATKTRVQDDDPEQQLEFGSPLFDPGCKIFMIAPEQPVVSSTGFDDGDAIREAINQGRAAGARPRKISAPVPDEHVTSVNDRPPKPGDGGVIRAGRLS